MWSRRSAIKAGLGLSLAPVLSSCQKWTRWGLPITLHLPGMAAGHRLRNLGSLPQPQGCEQTPVLILGSGVGGLFAAWRLRQQGFHDFLLVEGPEFGGNCAAGQHAGLSYPRGAHYLPLPAMAARHVRELLADMEVIEGDPYSTHPRFDERVLVHAPAERLWINGAWQDGLLPRQGISDHELAEQQRFFAQIDRLKQTHGSDGKRVFESPIALSSRDPSWRALDQISFARWLDQHHYFAPSLRWYLDYACRDDYGITLAQTSAWAGLHYFAGRDGQAANAENGAVLTWPNGLAPIITHLAHGLSPQQRRPGMAITMQETATAVAVDILQNGQCRRILAQQVICALPLHIAARILPDLRQHFDRHQQAHAPWQVSNFILNGQAREPEESPLAWDNVVYGSPSLGFVDGSHQLIRTAKPEHSVWTAYHAYAGLDPAQTRSWMAQASADELFEVAAQDLHRAYGWHWRKHVQALEITLRGHAMASPTPGFLSKPGLTALQMGQGRIQFAHSDLSGLSVFEEASYWGDVAARRVLI